MTAGAAAKFLEKWGFLFVAQFLLLNIPEISN
jgi:hypothetical protein